jgi:archaeal flagellar protein FlaJ
MPNEKSTIREKISGFIKRIMPSRNKQEGEGIDLSNMKKIAEKAKKLGWNPFTTIKQFRVESKRKARADLARERKRHTLKYYLPKAGIDKDPGEFFNLIFYIAIGVNIAFTIMMVYYFSTHVGDSISYILMTMFLLWTGGFLLIFLLIWGVTFFTIDFMIYKRRVQIERVLPDFLMLTASNIKAGMTIDQALWYAVRPRFGVLAKEIEIVAKETMSGEDLKVALQKFAEKYDSPSLRRTVSLITEGIDAGGKIGDLLLKIASNLQESDLVRKEMSASVTTYVIFITFATIVAAPVLFALSTQMISVVTGITSNIDVSQTGNLATTIKIGKGGINILDFKKFVLIAMGVGSLFSAMIVSAIKHGNVRDGIGNIPLFACVSFLIYFLANYVLSSVFSQFF